MIKRPNFAFSDNEIQSVYAQNKWEVNILRSILLNFIGNVIKARKKIIRGFPAERLFPV